MRLVKILHVVGWLAPRYGGTREVVVESQAWLSERGHQVDIVTTNVDGPGTLDVETGRPVDWAGVRATFHPVTAPRAWLTSWPLLADLRHRIERYDVIHVHGLYRFHTIAAARVAQRRRVPYIMQAHGSLNPPTRARHRRLKDGYHRLIEDSNIQGAAVVLCTSETEAQAIRRLGYSTPSRVVPLGIDVDALRAPEDPRAFLDATGIEHDAQIVTYIGRISREKGVDLLVDAFARTAAQFPKAHLVVAGPDDQGIAERLLHADPPPAFGDRISFVGTITGYDKRALLQRSQVVVLPSSGESFGLAIAEAMAVGRPVIVTPAVPLQEAVLSAGAGLVTDRDADAIAVAVGQILADPEAASRMGAAGKQVIDDRFTWRQVALELERMYEAVAVRATGSMVERPSRTGG